MKRPSKLFTYGFAVLVTAISLVLTKSVHPLMTYYAFDLFQGAVFLSAWFGGRGPGLATTGLSILTMDYFLMPPLYAFHVSEMDDMVRLGVFGIVGLMVSSLSAGLREAHTRLQSANGDLERRLNERTQEVLAISGREQERIGQDLHDGLCQTLAGVRLLTQAVQGRLAAQAPGEAHDLAKIETRLEQAQAQANAVTHGLYPVELETDGLMAGLQELADRTSDLYPASCRFSCRKPALIQDHASAVHVYRIAQEAVRNAVKGGKARRISIRLFTFMQHHILAIADDGVGFSPDPKRRGMGLKIMDYRSRMIGAKLQFLPRKKGGTLVACTFPASEAASS